MVKTYLTQEEENRIIKKNKIAKENTRMAREVPQDLELPAEVAPFGGEPVFDSQRGDNIQDLLTSTDGTIVPMGSAALIVLNLQDGQQIGAHTTVFNEAPDGQYTRDDGSWLVFSQYPRRIFRPTADHSCDIRRQTHGWPCLTFGGGCLEIAPNGTCVVNPTAPGPNSSYEYGFTATARTPIQRLRVYLLGVGAPGGWEPTEEEQREVGQRRREALALEEERREAQRRALEEQRRLPPE